MPPKYCETDETRLQCSLDILNGRLAQVKEHIKDKRKHKRAATLQVTKHLMQTARIILCLPHGGLDMAVHYLMLKASLPSKDTAVHRTNLEKWSAVTAETDKHMWQTNPPYQKGKAAMKEDEKFLTEWALHDWVRRQNIEKGIAPLGAIVWSQREKDLTAAAAAGEVPRQRPIKQKARLQWLRHWRVRWRINLGTIQAREHVPEDECRSKAEHKQFNHYWAAKDYQNWSAIYQL
jgi:hypothetical protein